MNNKTSFIVSVIFHPVVINLLSLYLLFTLFPSLAALNKNATTTIMGVIVSLTIILPTAIVAILKLTNQISSIQLTNLKDRLWPFIFTCIGYLMSFYLLNKAGVSVIILKYLIAGSITVISLTIVSSFWQISVHMASMGALVSLLVIINNYLQLDLRLFIAMGISVSGLVASARYFSNAHNISQLISGFVVGFASIFIVL